MIVVATLLSDIKYATRMTALPAMLQIKGDVKFYVNIETEHGFEVDWWGDVLEALKNSKRPFDYDRWHRGGSWWRRQPSDQDTSRLEPICIARNMARTYAMNLHAERLLFIDSDVVVYPNGLEQLMKLDWPLVGGLVPGRGAHNTAQYVFGVQKRERNLVYCRHGTLGYCLIRSDLFSMVPFRYGPDPLDLKAAWLSEDPAFAHDAAAFHNVPYWIVDMNVRAKHLDDPAHPLTLDESVNNYNIPNSEVK